MAPSKSLDAKFRPLPAQKESNSPRIFLSEDSYIYLTGSVDNGKLCSVQGREAILWIDRSLNQPPSTKDAPVPARTTKAFQEACGFNFSDIYRITCGSGAIPSAHEILVQDVSAEAVSLPEAEQLRWNFALRSYICMLWPGNPSFLTPS